MPDFSLVPVEHQPDFEDASLVPVDQDPFSSNGAVRQPQVQQVQKTDYPVQTQSSSQQPAMEANQPDVPALDDGPKPSSDQGKPEAAPSGEAAARTDNTEIDVAGAALDLAAAAASH